MRTHRKPHFAVSVDGFRHTSLRDTNESAFGDMYAPSGDRHERPGSHNLSAPKVRHTLKHQQHLKQEMEGLQRGSRSPSLVRL